MGIGRGELQICSRFFFIDFEILTYGLCVCVSFFVVLVKVAPSIATSFFTYELVKEFLGAS